MLTLAHHPTTPVVGRPAPQPHGHGPDQPKPAPPPADREEPQTFLLILLRALGTMHT